MAPDSDDARYRKLRHDLANPVAAILAETQLLLLNGEALDADTVRALRDIEAQCRRMRDILHQSME